VSTRHGAVAHHEDLRRGDELRIGSNRSFGLVFAAFFALLWVWPFARRGTAPPWPLAASAAVLAVALLWPALLAPLNRAWMRLGLLLQHVVSPLILGLLFYLVVTPMGLIARLLGKRPLSLGFDRGAPSYWIDRRPPGPAPDTMPNQF